MKTKIITLLLLIASFIGYGQGSTFNNSSVLSVQTNVIKNRTGIWTYTRTGGKIYYVDKDQSIELPDAAGFIAASRTLTLAGSNGITINGTTSATFDLSANRTWNIAVASLGDASIASGANIDISKLGTGIISTTEFNYLDGVTSNIQTQLSGMMPIAGGTFSGNVFHAPTTSQSIHADSITTDYQRFKWYVYNPNGGGYGKNSKLVLETKKRNGTIFLRNTLVIDNGNVGINIFNLDSSEPSKALTVEGDIKMTQQLFLNTATYPVGQYLKVGNDGVMVAEALTAREVTLAGTQTLTNKTLTSPVITNIAPAANFTLTQNSVTPFVSVNAGAVANTMYLNAGNVGIGTTAPATKLDVSGGIRVSGDASFSNSSATGGIYIGPIGFQASVRYNTNGNLDFIPRSGYNSVFPSGNVGIGTNAPNQKLEIANAGATSLRINNTASSTWDITNTATSTLNFVRGGSNTYLSIGATGNIGVGTATSQAPIDIVGANGPRFLLYGTGGTAGYQSGMGVNMAQTPNSMGFFIGKSANFSIDVANAVEAFPHASGYSTKFTMLNSGNVGIGVVAPAQKLEVSGTVKAQGLWLSTVDKTAAYTATLTDYAINGDATSAGFTITLPTASTNAGQILVIMKTDASANAITIAGTINGVANRTLSTQYSSLTIQSNGTNYYIR